MTDKTKKTAQLILTPSQFKAFEECFDNLVDEFRTNGKLDLSSFTKILGNPPTIPHSPDMDARLEAFEERALYGSKLEKLDSLIKLEA